MRRLPGIASLNRELREAREKKKVPLGVPDAGRGEGGNRRRTRGARGRKLQCLRSERVERRWCRYRDFEVRVGGRWLIPIKNVETVETALEIGSHGMMVLA